MVVPIEQNHRRSRATARIMRLRRGQRWPQDGMRDGILVSSESLSVLSPFIPGSLFSCERILPGIFRPAHQHCPVRKLHTGKMLYHRLINPPQSPFSKGGGKAPLAKLEHHIISPFEKGGRGGILTSCLILQFSYRTTLRPMPNRESFFPPTK